MAEIFINLITNAIKYNDKANKWIEIGWIEGQPENRDRQESHGCKSVESDGTSVETVFYFKDNGIGIREKHLPMIFKIFKRLHGQDKFGGGTGVGLTIIQKIIERHGGRIWVESTFGEGTSFYFTLEETPVNRLASAP